MNQFLKNHQLNKAEIGVTDESISDWISGSQDTFSSIPDLSPIISLYLSAIWSAFATSKCFWLVALYISFSYFFFFIFLKYIIYLIQSSKYIQYKDVVLGIYMIYLSLHCEWQLHYWASSTRTVVLLRASYHLQGKYI